LNTPSSFTPPTNSPVELKIKWAPNEHVVQEFDMDQKMAINLPGRSPMEQDMSMGQKFSLAVLNADADGGHEIEMEFLSARMAMEMGQNTMSYDSDKDSASGSTNPIASVFSKMIGSKFHYFLDASNNVVQIDGIDELISRLADGGRTAAQFKSMFTEDYFKQLMGANRLLPPNPVQPGDTWQVQIQVPAGFTTLSMDYTLTFTGWEKHGERNCARIDFTGTIQSQPGGNPNPMGMTMSVPEGNTSGVFWFDPEFGTAIDSKSNQEMTMVITLPSRAKQGMQGGSTQTMTNELSQTVTFKVDSLN
jgi:hypothetical protein